MTRPRQRGFFIWSGPLAICYPTRLSFAANTLPLRVKPPHFEIIHTGKRLDAA
jgi:hypothetical protein